MMVVVCCCCLVERRGCVVRVPCAFVLFRLGILISIWLSGVPYAWHAFPALHAYGVRCLARHRPWLVS